MMQPDATDKPPFVNCDYQRIVPAQRHKLL